MVVNAQQQQAEISSLAFFGASLIAGIVTSPQLDFQAAEKANLHFSVTVVFHLFLATAVGTLTLSDDLTMNGTLTVTSGTLDTANYLLDVAKTVNVDDTLSANASTIKVGSDWDNTGGTFTAGTSTVILRPNLLVASTVTCID